VKYQHFAKFELSW